MTAGITAAMANTMLDTIATPMAFVKLHTGDPGSAGTSNASSVTTRPALAWASAASGSKAGNGTLPSWTSWAGTNGEIVTHVSFWSASTAGTFAGSAALAASQTLNTGNTFSLTAVTATATPLAA